MNKRTCGIENVEFDGEQYVCTICGKQLGKDFKNKIMRECGVKEAAKIGKEVRK